MLKKIFIILIIAAVTLIIFVTAVNIYILNFSQPYLINQKDLDQQSPVAIVLGALVWPSGTMSDIFKDRVDTALELYKQGKVEKILISGDHGRKNYDEVNSAKDYLLEQGVNSEDIFMDHAGFDTYDSLYRARDVFGVKQAIIITQNFHLPRALYIGQKLGLEVTGLSADKHLYAGLKGNRGSQPAG